MHSTKDKQLSDLNRATVMALVDAGFPLSLRELAVATGYSYTSVRGWKGMGLPILSGRVSWEDFLAWKRIKLGLESSRPAAANPQPPVIGNCGGFRPRRR